MNRSITTTLHTSLNSQVEDLFLLRRFPYAPRLTASSELIRGSNWYDWMVNLSLSCSSLELSKEDPASDIVQTWIQQYFELNLTKWKVHNWKTGKDQIALMIWCHTMICWPVSDIADCRLQTADHRPQTADRRPQTADRRPQTADRRPKTADCRLQTKDYRLHTVDLRP